MKPLKYLEFKPVNMLQLGMTVEEILQKEEEKHQLLRTGLVTDWHETLRLAIKMNGLDAAGQDFDKQTFLHYFYHTILRYGYVIDREKYTNEALKKYFFAKTRALLASLKNSSAETALLDSELKTGAQLSIAYHLPESIYQTFYAAFCCSETIFNRPEEAYSFFYRELKEKYPLYIDDYTGALKNDDAACWELTCRYIQDVSCLVVRFALEKSGNRSYADIVRDHTWSRAYEIMRERLVEQKGRMPAFRTGKDFRNYLIQICHFLADNVHKKYTGKKEVYAIDDVLPYLSPLTEEEAEDELERENDIKELDVDTGNPYEVAYAVSIILLNPHHPLHHALTEGIEDKVAILIEKSLHGKSYNDIVAARFTPIAGEDDFRRAVAKARKDYERVRKTLQSRLIELAGKKTSPPGHNRHRWQIIPKKQIEL
jgi:hypothetical protein